MTNPSPSILALALALAASPALAQGTQAQRQACTPDVFRLCASHIPNVSAITGCLRREEPRLSPACRTAMQAVTAPQVARREPAERSAAAPAPRRSVVVRHPHPAAEARVRVGRAQGRLPPRYAARPVAGRQAARQRRARYAGLGGSREMREARMWLNRLGGLAGLAGMAGLDGASLAGIREMRVGEILDMMP